MGISKFLAKVVPLSLLSGLFMASFANEITFSSFSFDMDLRTAHSTNEVQHSVSGPGAGSLLMDEINCQVGWWEEYSSASIEPFSFHTYVDNMGGSWSRNEVYLSWDFFTDDGRLDLVFEGDATGTHDQGGGHSEIGWEVIDLTTNTTLANNSYEGSTIGNNGFEYEVNESFGFLTNANHTYRLRMTGESYAADATTWQNLSVSFSVPESSSLIYLIMALLAVAAYMYLPRKSGYSV